jgi:predicted transcriptional regulator
MIEFRKSIQKRNSICAIIEKSPGSCYSDIKKKSGFANGILSHHIKILEKNGHIRVRRENRKTWFFLPESDPKNDFLLIYSKKETYRKILTFLLQEKQATFNEIRTNIGKSPSTTSLALSNLFSRNLIKKTHDFKKKYEINDYTHALELLSKEEPKTSDKIKDRFADTFSYF